MSKKKTAPKKPKTSRPFELAKKVATTSALKVCQACKGKGWVR